MQRRIKWRIPMWWFFSILFAVSFIASAYFTSRYDWSQVADWRQYIFRSIVTFPLFVFMFAWYTTAFELVMVQIPAVILLSLYNWEKTPFDSTVYLSLTVLVWSVAYKPSLQSTLDVSGWLYRKRYAIQ